MSCDSIVEEMDTLTQELSDTTNPARQRAIADEMLRLAAQLEALYPGEYTSDIAELREIMWELQTRILLQTQSNSVVRVDNLYHSTM